MARRGEASRAQSVSLALFKMLIIASSYSEDVFGAGFIHVGSECLSGHRSPSDMTFEGSGSDVDHDLMSFLDCSCVTEVCFNDLDIRSGNSGSRLGKKPRFRAASSWAN